MLISSLGIAQENLNDYKYIIIPKQFDNFNKPNQYQTSTLLKYSFIEKGFLAVYEDAVPDDFYENTCLGLTVSLKDESNMFNTKLLIVLKDCKGQEVFTSMEAKNKLKDYHTAYKAAIFEAMSSFDNLNYSFSAPMNNEMPITVSFKNDVKTLKEHVPESPEVKNKAKAVVQTKPKNTDFAVTQTATDKVQSYKNIEPITSNIKKSPKEMTVSKISNEEDRVVLYAQPIANGYQLVDGTPKVIMKLLKSSTENVYMANGNGKSGMVFKSENIWVFEYYKGDLLVRENLNIKF